MICASAERQLSVFDLRKPNVVFKKIQSPLKHATNSHALKLFPDRHGFIVGSIEGRCGVHHILDEESGYNFAFKCHREQNKIYNVHSIDFHPQYSTFATTGGDGKFHFWDKDSKQRLRIFPKLDNTIPIGKFNRDGSLFAYAVCYDWSRGSEGPTNFDTHLKPSVQIGIHKPAFTEIKNRGVPPYENKNSKSRIVE
ncbi:mRNA export factor RAE1 [Acrasis kona]